VALRYFNVFGPHQDPEGQYAAVIPRFVQALLNGEPPVIFGDGEQTRDFTYVENVIQANLLACQAPAEAVGQVFNIGAGGRVSINQLYQKIAELLGSDLEPKYESARQGDVMHSQAGIEKAKKLMGYDPKIGVMEGLERAIEWYREAFGD